MTTAGAPTIPQPVVVPLSNTAIFVVVTVNASVTAKAAVRSLCEDLGALVRKHRPDDSMAKAIDRIIRTDLIIVDDIGLLPVSTEAAEGFYRLVDAAYERRSLAVSSNLHPSGFDEIMPKTLATATVDRLLHHAHVVVTQGDSYRLTEATSGRGVHCSMV